MLLFENMKCGFYCSFLVEPRKKTAETQANCFQSISRPCLREKEKKSKNCRLESFSQELYWKYTPTHIHCVYPSGLYLNSLVCISTRKANQSDGRVRNLHFLRKKKKSLYHIRTIVNNKY